MRVAELTRARVPTGDPRRDAAGASGREVGPSDAQDASSRRQGNRVWLPFSVGRHPANCRKAVCHTDRVAALPLPLRRAHVAGRTVLLAIVLSGALVLVGPVASAGASSRATTSTPLKAPKTTYAQDTKFFASVAEADSALASYEQKQGNVALRALLTDGSAFCALLTRRTGLDQALVDEATGVRSTDAQTHLPLSVTTFNAIESVALLALCPSEQKLVPTSVRNKIRTLGKALGARPG
jgi:hypothetical protein